MHIGMKNRIFTIPALTALLAITGAVSGFALIDLEWRPGCTSVDPGESIEIGLWAVSDDETDQSIAAMDVIILWDPDVMTLTGVSDDGPYDWIVSTFPNDAPLDGLNDTFLDGNALYSAYAQLGNPAYATPEGLLVTTFLFQSEADEGFNWLIIPEHAGSYSHTRVFDGVIPNLDVHGLLDRAAAGVGVFDLIYGYMSCTPLSGTVPFNSRFWAVLGNNYTDYRRRLAGRINVTLASGKHYSYWRAGWTNLFPGECYATSWTQVIPSLGALIGDNIFTLEALDVTPSPWNQPPYPPSGGTDTDTCTMTCYSP